jgi:hypothetical protein
VRNREYETPGDSMIFEKSRSQELGVRRTGRRTLIKMTQRDRRGQKGTTFLHFFFLLRPVPTDGWEHSGRCDLVGALGLECGRVWDE